jgi:hypothetical protein
MDPADSKGSLGFTRMIDPICENDCMVLTNNVSLEFEDHLIADVAHGIYDHHVVLMDMGKFGRAITCPSNSTSAFKGPKSPGIFGSHLYTSTDGNFKSGYYMKESKTPKLAMNVDLMNYNKDPKTVYIVLESEYIPGKPDGYLDVQTLVLSAAPCAQLQFKLPAPQYSVTSGAWIVPHDGYLVNSSKKSDHLVTTNCRC